MQHFFSKNIHVFAIFNDQSFNDMLTNNIISFEQLGSGENREIWILFGWKSALSGAMILIWQRVVPTVWILSDIPKCRRCRSAVSAAVKPRTWQLHSAVCLQRFPVITQELTPLEEKYLGLLQEREVRGSLLSDYELQEIDEK